MTLRLVPRSADPHRFADHAISRLRLEPSRRAVSGAGSGIGARRRPLLSDAPPVEDPRGEDLFLDELGATEPGPDNDPDHVPPGAPDPAPDYAVARAQAEAEDLALVRLAAARLAVALHEVAVLLRGERGSQRSDALARCTAKGWITLQGDPWSASPTFRVTPEGYQAAGLRPPPFAS